MADIKDDIRSLSRQVAELRNELKENALMNDLMNRKEAIAFTGLKPKTFSSRMAEGKIKPISTGPTGTQFFSRKQLAGLIK